MGIAGLRELRQQASDLVRRVEGGEVITVTVNGREVAQLVPVERDAWRRWSDVADVFTELGDAEWAEDRKRVDQTVLDPFDR